MPSGVKGMPYEIKGMPSEIKGIPDESKGMPSEPKGIPAGAARAEDIPSDYQAGTSRVYHYAEADYGKAADYENSTGARGPWSNVVSLIISG
ncbi:MAG: hypothetical protein LBD07_01330 [Spirochaetaceae bacterium]|nr:hypothetical protein [Spirochaetaceae bacterium]